MWKQALSALALAGFLAATWQALADHSYPGFFLIAGANSATRLMLLDLTLALALVSLWLVADARRAGGSYVPFLLVTLGWGVAGPLLYLTLRPRRRAVQRAVALALLALLFAASTLTWPIADVRTDAVASPGAEERGRVFLHTAARRHGWEAWKKHEALEIDAVDRWPGGGPWWPAPEQAFVMRTLLGTFSSRAILRGGEHEGAVWGIQAWEPYRRERLAAPAHFLDQSTPEIEFYLPTLHYFLELPFRLLEADVIRDAGDAELRGRPYHRVFVTWRDPAPSLDYDQYLVWIDAETNLIETVRYTLRDAVRMADGAAATLYRSLALGTIAFEDYREIDGVMLPFEQTVILQAPELAPRSVDGAYFHRLTIERARFEGVDGDSLIVDPARGAPADKKPAS